MFTTNKALRFGMFIALLLLIIFLVYKVGFVFRPFIVLVQVVAIPLLLSVFFYYLLRPLVQLMGKYKVNRILAILIIYMIFSAALVWFIFSQWPLLYGQLTSFLDNVPNLLNAVGEQINALEKNGFLSSWFSSADNHGPSTITDYLNKGFSFLSNYVGGLFSFISNFAVILFTFPILLFFMLKEGERFGELLVRATPIRYQKDSREIISSIDRMLSGFIVGRVIVNISLGVLMYFGFLIIGLPYAFLLTAVSVIANFIPFIGAILSSVPILIVGLTQSPATALWSLVIILVAQQVQDNLIAPYVFGKKLDIHPLTTVILVLAAGNIGGIIAMIIIIPVYMMLKIITVRVFSLFFKEKWMQL
ncbi:AI-2E family transporter [Paenibacillus dokdonensis]|uniref:AI-2E family transporter n=1 Tax=Paenibacillus dokdonensis TaxID=2567944 RepID=A0ABU6GRA7_9BACL|nr:AI-2E family transporter [Paenibacillus dokdonensis]MEC0241748.1 AI-2E family transporter [Paenibacillus dokdonensis]